MIEEKMHDDLISRQQAIDAVKIGAFSAATIYGRTDEGSTALHETVRAIKALPPAEPKITHCKDCKHYNAGFECIIEGYGIERSADWYCGDAERRNDD